MKAQDAREQSGLNTELFCKFLRIRAKCVDKDFCLIPDIFAVGKLDEQL